MFKDKFVLLADTIFLYVSTISKLEAAVAEATLVTSKTAAAFNTRAGGR
jgi:hypothetical protein